MSENFHRSFYIDGAWRAASSDASIDVLNPATETVIARIAHGGAADVDAAVAAARRAFAAFAQSSVADRIDLLQRIDAGLKGRLDDFAYAMSREMGVPLAAARTVHFPSGPAHCAETIRVLREFPFEARHGTTMIRREPIGVCALITPWNFPINQVICKVAPALAAGCTMVLKPSEVAPLSALIIAEVIHEAGVPAGVFNLVNGDGATTGHAMVAHTDVDMVSFTGSTRAGIAVAKAAADSVKRVAQELGGKSANILMPDADFERAVTLGVARCFNNTGQSCIAPSRMLVPRDRLGQVAAIASRAAEAVVVGMPSDEATTMGPVATRAQFDKVQRLIRAGIEEGGKCIVGGLGRPPGLTRGFFVRPTIFIDVDPRSTIAQEEIFGPVLSIIAYDDEQDAVRIANDTRYGLGAFIQSGSLERARSMAQRMRVGNVQINYAPVDRGAPFGGYKQSGNGREWGEWGLAEFLEIKGIQGYWRAD